MHCPPLSGMPLYPKGLVLHLEKVPNGLGHEQQNGAICGELELPILPPPPQNPLESPPPTCLLGHLEGEK